MKKDGITIPKIKKSATLEEYHALKEQVHRMDAQIRRLEAVLDAADSSGCSGPGPADGEQTIDPKEE